MPRAPKAPGHTVKIPWETSRHRGSTRESRQTRTGVLQAWPSCYLQYEGCSGQSTEDDHVIPLHKGGTDDISNRRGACRHCHRIKTQHEAAQARHGPRDGTPPPRH